VVLLIFILMFGVCFGAFWFVVKPSGTDKKAEKRLRAVTRSIVSGLDSRLSTDGILRPASDASLPWHQRTRLWRWFARLLEESDAQQTPKDVLLWSLGAGVAATVIGMLVLPAPLLVAGAGCVGLYAPIIRLRFLRTRRMNKFETVLPDSLDLMARALRSGHAVSAAIEVVAEQGREPVAQEFRSLFQQQSLGLPFRDALETMMKRIPSDDLQFAGTAMLVQKESGGNLAEILDRTVEIMRERVRIRGEVRTKTAQGKLTGLILALLPVAMLLIISFTNPDYAKQLTATPVGHKLLYASSAMIAIGWMFIRKIVNIEI
jgi:tight adherence protein B